MMVANSVQSNAKTSMSSQNLFTRSRTSSLHESRSATEAEGIIIGSVLGGTALILISAVLILFPIWRRRRHAQQTNPISKGSPSRLSNPSCPSPLPPPLSPPDIHAVRPVTPSPRRLAIDASAPQATNHLAAREWHHEKARTVHTPTTLHPAIVFRGDMFTKDCPQAPGCIDDVDGHQHQQQQQPQHYLSNSPGSRDTTGTAVADSISSAFAAEMSSLLESISLKSSYSSLRSGGLGAPPRMLRKPMDRGGEESCATTVGATWGSVSEAGGGDPHPSPGFKPPSYGLFERPMSGKRSKEDVQGGFDGEEVTIGMGFASG